MLRSCVCHSQISYAEREVQSESPSAVHEDGTVNAFGIRTGLRSLIR